MKKVDLCSSEWCDLIFEGRNKSYGAYKLRTNSEKRHTLSMIGVVVGVLIVYFVPVLITKWVESREDEVSLDQITALSQLQKPDAKPHPLKKVEDIKVPENPSIKMKAPVDLIKFTAPVITRDNEVTATDQRDESKAFAQSKDPMLINTDTAQYALPEQLALTQKPDEDIKYEVVDSMPEFPGGQAALYQYLSTNIKYPFWAQRYNMQGEVVVQFIVNADGSLSDCHIERGVGSYLNEEALRVFRSMPKWRPARKKGKPIRSRCVVPVEFRLN
jgi:protein TonB